MDQKIDTDLDQVNEEILTYTVSDEALEAAAGRASGNCGKTWEHIAGCSMMAC